MSLISEIGALYEGLDDVESLHGFLDQATRVYRGSNAGATWIDLETGRYQYANAGMPEPTLNEFLPALMKDPWAIAALHRPEQAFVVKDEELVPWREYRQTRFFSLLQPLGTRHIMVSVGKAPRYVIGLSVHRTGQAGAFDHRIKRDLQGVLPHLVRFGHLLWQETHFEHVTASAFPVLEIDTRGVVWMNEPAGDWLASHGHLAVIRERTGLALRDPTADARLQMLVQAIVQNRWEDLPPHQLCVSLGRAGVILVLPATRRGVDFVRHPVARLLFLVTEAELPQRALYEFGLTPAESAIVRALVAGKTLKEFAIEQGKSIETVRTQLKQVFGKTGCRSQVALIARFAAPNPSID